LINAPHIQRSERIKKPHYGNDHKSFRSTAKVPGYASRKVREAKLAAGHAKRKVWAAGTAAKTHVTRNKAAYIAGGAGLAAGAVLARRKKAQNQD